MANTLRLDGTATPARSYKRPPAVETVIELKYRTPIDEQTIKKVAKKFRPHYPRSERQTGVEYRVDIKTGKIDTVPEWHGLKLASEDAADVLFIRTMGFSHIRLAPYLGWNRFIDGATRNWVTAIGVIGRRAISRVGLRYMNRLDVPVQKDKELKIEDYLRIIPITIEFGLKWDPISTYLVHFTRSLGVDGFFVNVSTGTTDSPLVNHRSLLLDIDVYSDGLNLLKDSDIWNLAAKMRTYKNDIFEATVTDNARALFET